MAGIWVHVVLASILLKLVAGCSGNATETANVIVVTMDTTRVDRLSSYGYRWNTSPNLDRLAQDSVRFTRAYSTSSWTLPAHASLFTGRFPSSHGAIYDVQGPVMLSDAILTPGTWPDFRVRGLAASEITLAEILSDHGYTTGAVVAGPWMKRVFGLDQGFDDYDDSDIQEVAGRRADAVTAAAIQWVERNQADPFFLFLNYFDPHTPYDPPPEYRSRFSPGAVDPEALEDKNEKLRALYDAEIAFMDDALGKLLDRLRQLGLYDRTWVVVTADHGEKQGERGRWGHGTTLTQPEIHIPLLVKEASAEPRSGVDDSPIQLVDVLPLLLDGLGIAIPDSIQGGFPSIVSHPVVAEIYPLPSITRHGHWRAILEGDLKFTWNSRGRHQLFDLAADPTELVDIREDSGRDSLLLEQRLETFLASLPPPGEAGPPRTLDAQTSQALQNLGYLRSPPQSDLEQSANPRSPAGN